MAKRTIHTVEGVWRNLIIRAVGDNTDLMYCWECPQRHSDQAGGVSTCGVTGEALGFYDGPIRREDCKSETFETDHTTEERDDEDIEDGI